jgi:hypothetical protein
MSLLLDWWQLGWAVAGFFLVMFFALYIGTHNQYKKGVDVGWHDRQHWETDQIAKGKLERQ